MRGWNFTYGYGAPAYDSLCGRNFTYGAHPYVSWYGMVDHYLRHTRVW